MKTTSYIKVYLLLLLGGVISSGSVAQITDTVSNKKPIIKAESKKQVPDSVLRKHSPRKATLMSTVCPGLGQIYNHKYWKLPIIYAGIGATGYLFTKNTIKYLNYRNALRARLSGDSTDTYTDLSNDALLTDQNRFHRSRDFMAILFCGVYALQVVDACVDAHLFYFDVSDDLSLNIYPKMINNNSAGICLRFNIHQNNKHCFKPYAIK